MTTNIVPDPVLLIREARFILERLEQDGIVTESSDLIRRLIATLEIERRKRQGMNPDTKGGDKL